MIQYQNYQMGVEQNMGWGLYVTVRDLFVTL